MLDTLERAADEPEEPATWQDAVRGIAGILERSTAGRQSLIDLARSAIGRIDDESKLVRALGLADRYCCSKTKKVPTPST